MSQDDDWPLVANAFRSVVDVLRQQNTIFILVVVMSTVLLVAMIGSATGLVMWAVHRMEGRMVERDIQAMIRLQQITDRMQVQQTVTVSPGRTRDDNVRDVLKNQGAIE